jgi:hypothetical protein
MCFPFEVLGYFPCGYRDSGGYDVLQPETHAH